MKKIISLILISNFVLAQTVDLDTNAIRIGEQTKLSISYPLDGKQNIVWPIFNDTIVKGVEIIDISPIDTIINHDTKFRTIKQSLIITAWDSGSYYIPSFIFSENTQSEQLVLNVHTITIEEGATEKDIKGPIDIPLSLYDIIPWILILLVVYIIYYLIKKYILKNQTKKEAEEEKTIIIPCHEIAFQKLENLASKKLWQNGEIKKYHSEISEIIRTYLEGRYNFIAMELPTTNILQELKGKQLTTELIHQLGSLLERADLAKFAKSKPSPTENKESMVLAKTFVKNTKKEDV